MQRNLPLSKRDHRFLAVFRKRSKVRLRLSLIKEKKLMRNSWTGCGETLQQSTALIMRQPIYLGDASHHCPATPYFAVSAPFSVSADQSEAVFDYNRKWQVVGLPSSMLSSHWVSILTRLPLCLFYFTYCSTVLVGSRVSQPAYGTGLRPNSSLFPRPHEQAGGCANLN